MPKALPPKPSPAELKSHNNLSVQKLLKTLRKSFEKIADSRVGEVEYSLTDTLMSALAVFGLKFPSLRKFDEKRTEKPIKHNLKS